MSECAAGLFGWACVLIVGLLAAGGAASTPGGLLLGAPPLGASLGVAGLVGAGWLLAGARGGRLGLGLVPFALALVVAPWIPGVAAWTGPALLAPALGVLAVALRPLASRPFARRALMPGLFALYAVFAWRVQVQVGPEGDEPHYLMVADSLLHDGDLSLEDDYRHHRYASFYRKDELAPHYRVRGRGGEIYSLHAIGLSLLVLPAYAVGGYPAVSFFMALLLALLVRELSRLLSAWGIDPGDATWAVWLVGLSPPLVHYAGLVFTEVPAALLLTLALRLGARPARSTVAGSVLAVAVALLPWLNIRYAALAAIAVLYAASRDRRPRAVLGPLGAGAASAVGLGLYHQALYGFLDPRRVYGPRPELSLSQLSEGLPGLLLDQEFGLLAYAPIFVLALPGLARLLRRDRAAALAAAAVVASSLLLAGSWHMWRGGFNPPARFLLPAVPALAAGLATAASGGVGSGATLLAGWGLWVGIQGAWEPRLVHRDRDGSAPFFRSFSGAEEWTRLLPGYVLAEPDRGRLALIWGAALAAAAIGRRPAGARRLATASLIALGATAAAAGAAQRRAGGREAVHLVGRSALGWPLVERATRARWSPADLDWGPAYEPHRHPAGAAIGERLELLPGAYELVIQAELLGPEPPLLQARFERRKVPETLQARRVPGGIDAHLDVPPGAGPVTLLLAGGSPLILKELRLRPSTFAP